MSTLSTFTAFTDFDNQSNHFSNTVFAEEASPDLRGQALRASLWRHFWLKQRNWRNGPWEWATILGYQECSCTRLARVILTLVLPGFHIRLRPSTLDHDDADQWKAHPLRIVSSCRHWRVLCPIFFATVAESYVTVSTKSVDSNEPSTVLRAELINFIVPTAPGTSPVWDVGPMSNIYLNVENTIHYQLNSSTTDAEWAAMIPPNGGIVYVGPTRQPFMPSIFHQLRCLNIIRQTYVAKEGASDELQSLSRHCMNYLRQMIMCRANLRLEPVVDPFGAHAVDPWGKLTCKDWRAVYAAHERNRRDYGIWQKEQKIVK